MLKNKNGNLFSYFVHTKFWVEGVMAPKQIHVTLYVYPATI